MENGIKINGNKIIIDLRALKDKSLSGIIQRLKELVYDNNVNVFDVIAGMYDNEIYEFYFFKSFIGQLRETFSIFLMLKTRYFQSTKFFDSIFALGVDALTLSVSPEDRAADGFSDMMAYVTNLWTSGAVFTDISAENCTDKEIMDEVSFYAKLKVIPRIVKEKACDPDSAPFCLRDFIISSLKENGISMKWVVNFELCGLIQQQEGGRGRSKRKIAGKVALELASLRRKLMVKEVQSSFDSASL